MKILNAKVYEFPKGVMNPPKLQILVDKVHTTDEFTFDQKHTERGTAYFAEDVGDVRFFFHDPKNESGYGGHVFTLHLTNGETVRVKGLWSSRPSAMIPLFGIPCMDADMTDIAEVLERGYTYYARNITVDLARTALKFIPGWTIVEKETSYGEMNWELQKEEI